MTPQAPAGPVQPAQPPEGREVPEESWQAALHGRCPVRIGARVQLTLMPDEEDPIPPGTWGTCYGGNGVQVWVRWDNGRALAMKVGTDTWEVARDPERLVGLWERWAANPDRGEPPSRWVVDRNYPLRYWLSVNPALSLEAAIPGPTTRRGGHREYRLFEQGVDPNTLLLPEDDPEEGR